MVKENIMGRLYLFFRVAPPGCDGRRIKRLVILFVPGYTVGLPRFASVSPGRETGRDRGKAGLPGGVSGTNKMTSRFIQGRYLYCTVNRSPAGQPEKKNYPKQRQNTRSHRWLYKQCQTCFMKENILRSY